jgi:hypothetical protein
VDVDHLPSALTFAIGAKASEDDLVLGRLPRLSEQLGWRRGVPHASLNRVEGIASSILGRRARRRAPSCVAELAECPKNSTALRWGSGPTSSRGRAGPEMSLAPIAPLVLVSGMGYRERDWRL